MFKSMIIALGFMICSLSAVANTLQNSQSLKCIETDHTQKGLIRKPFVLSLARKIDSTQKNLMQVQGTNNIFQGIAYLEVVPQANHSLKMSLSHTRGYCEMSFELKAHSTRFKGINQCELEPTRYVECSWL